MAQPVNPFHPGIILLEEFLQPGKMTQAAFAVRVGWTKARLNEFIRWKRGVKDCFRGATMRKFCGNRSC